MPLIDNILSQFPKKRHGLSPDMEAAHIEILKANRERRYFLAKISNLLESWMHLKVAGTRKGLAGKGLLEIGAGTLNHLPFENGHQFYEAIELFRELYLDKPGRESVQKFYSDIREVDPSRRFSRIVSIAILEHLTDLPYTIAKSGLLLEDGGKFLSGIPSEGGLLWGLSWRLTTAVAFFMRTGMNFAQHMKYEHVNDAKEIILILKYFYKSVRISRFPLPSHHLSLYVFLDASDPNIERCQIYLNDRAS